MVQVDEQEKMNEITIHRKGSVYADKVMLLQSFHGLISFFLHVITDSYIAVSIKYVLFTLIN